MIIGISGVAGSGKDTLFSLLSSRINCKKYSLAEELKKEVTPWCEEHYSINPLNCSRKDKESIRDFLVFHGCKKRAETLGRYWIDKLNEKILELGSEEKNKIITDIRYDDFENDEVSWLREELGGVLIHLSQYSVARSRVKVYSAPANPEEARNDPKIRGKADFKVEWPLLASGEELQKKLGTYVDELIFQIGYDKLGII